jgi:cell division protein FtsB
MRLRWQHWLLGIGVGLAAYFGYHAVNGSRGVLAWQELTAELTVAAAELDALAAERQDLQRKVDRLRSDGLDADLVDELARRGLGLVQPLDVIILLDPEPTPR